MALFEFGVLPISGEWVAPIIRQPPPSFGLQVDPRQTARDDAIHIPKALPYAVSARGGGGTSYTGAFFRKLQLVVTSRSGSQDVHPLQQGNMDTNLRQTELPSLVVIPTNSTNASQRHVTVPSWPYRLLDLTIIDRLFSSNARSSSMPHNTIPQTLTIMLPKLPQLHSAENTVILLAFLAAAYLTCRLGSEIHTAVKFREFARQNGCEPMKIAPNPIGGKIRRYFKLKNIDENILDTYLLKRFRKTGLTHGFVSRWTRQIKGVATVEPENFQAVLAKDVKSWGRPRYRENAVSPLLGPGILSQDGGEWSHARKLIKGKFSRTRIDGNLTVSAKHVNYLLMALPQPGNDGWTSFENVYSCFSRFAMDNSTEFMFGVSASTQSHHLVRQNRLKSTEATICMDGFEQAFLAAQGGIALRMRLGTSYMWADGPRYRFSAWHLTGIMDEYLRRSIEVAKKRLEAQGGQPTNILEAWVADDQPFRYISNQARHLIIAGFETTSSLIGFLVGLLASNPRVFNKLRAIIIDQFGTDKDPKDEINFENLKACKYLQYVMSETLRLYPGGPNIQRQALRNTVLPRGGGLDGDLPVAVPKGTVVNINIYLAQRRPEVWGEDALEWKPERWEGRKSSYDWIPFIAGPHMCLGQQYSLAQAGFVLVRMLRYFDKIEAPNGAMNLTLGWKTVLAPKHGTTVRFHRASD